MDTFGSIIYEYRTKAGISLRKFAERVRVSPAFVSKLEQNKTEGNASEETIKRIAVELDLPFKMLLQLAKKVPENELEIRYTSALNYFREDLKKKHERDD